MVVRDKTTTPTPQKLNKKRIDVKTRENIDDKELFEIIEHLKKLDKYEINLNTYVEINFDE